MKESLVIIKNLFFVFSFLICCRAYCETYVIGSQDFNYYPHYNFASELDKGFIWALLEAYSKHSGDKFIYLSMPVTRLQTELVKGTVDIIYPDNPIFRPAALEPQNKYYSREIVETISCVAVKPSFHFTPKSEIHRLSLPKGFSTMDWGGLIPQGSIELIEVTSSLQALQYVDKGKADATEVDYFVMSHLSKSSPSIDRFAVGVNLPIKITEFRLSTINHQGLVEKIETFIQSNPDVVESLKIQYGISNPHAILSSLSKQPKEKA